MRILHFYKTFMPDTMGGIEQVITTLVNKTSLLGIKNSLLVTSSTTEKFEVIHIEGVEVLRVKTTFTAASCPVSLELLAVYKKIIEQYDILHFHYPWPFGDVVSLLNPNKKVKIIVSYHADIFNQKFLKIFYLPVMRSFFNKVDKIIVSSSNLATTSRDLVPYRSKIAVIPFGMPKPVVKSDRMQYWQSKVGNNFLLFIGQFRYYKGISVLLEALHYFAVPLVLIGKGPLEKKLKQQVAKNKLQNVHFVGAVDDDDKSALLQLSRAVVLPSIVRAEAFGIALLEGAMCAKPLISTELGTGTSFINQDKVTGFVVEPNNSVMLGEAIKKIFTDDKLTQKMGQASYQHYLDKFTAEKMVSSYVECYKQISGSSF